MIVCPKRYNRSSSSVVQWFWWLFNRRRLQCCDFTWLGLQIGHKKCECLSVTLHHRFIRVNTSFIISLEDTHTPPCVVFRNTSCHTFTASLLPHWHVPLTCCPDTKLLTTTLTSFHITFLLYLHTHWHIDNSASFCKLENETFDILYTPLTAVPRHDTITESKTKLHFNLLADFPSYVAVFFGGVYIHIYISQTHVFCFLLISSKQVQAVS